MTATKTRAPRPKKTTKKVTQINAGGGIMVDFVETVTAPFVPKPKGLDQRAMIVHVSIGYFDGVRRDKRVTAETLDIKKADSDGGNWNTYLIPTSTIKPVSLAAANARSKHYDLTLPWIDGGDRVIRAEGYMDYVATMRKFREEFDKAVEHFIAVDYPEILRNASDRLGDLFGTHKYPTESEIRSKFYFHTHIKPVPQAGDFRVDLGAEMNAEVRAEIEASTRHAEQMAMAELWKRFYESVEKIAERLSDPDAVFRDSLIKNLTTMCELVPKMDISSDGKLDEIRKEVIAKLANSDAATLRENKPARADKAKAANDILKKMQEAMGMATPAPTP